MKISNSVTAISFISSPDFVQPMSSLIIAGEIELLIKLDIG